MADLAKEEDEVVEDEDEVIVTRAADNKVAPADEKKLVETSPDAVKPQEESQKPYVNPMGNPTVVIFAVVMAALVAAAQQPEIAAGKPMALFEPHVVPPPKASSSEVVIQFCQS